MIRRPPRSTLFPYTTLFRRRLRGDRPLCILDLAVPRDVEPAVGQLENVFLYDVDDLQAVAAQAAAERRTGIPGAEGIGSGRAEGRGGGRGGRCPGAPGS